MALDAPREFEFEQDQLHRRGGATRLADEFIDRVRPDETGAALSELTSKKPWRLLDACTVQQKISSRERQANHAPASAFVSWSNQERSLK